MSAILCENSLKNYSVQSFRIRYKCANPPPKKALTSPERVISATRALFDELDGGSSVEHFGAWFVNAQNEVIGFKAFNTGTVDQVAVYPRMVIHTALMIGAAGMILAHNHPSGYVDPSEEDRRLTRSIVEAGKLFDIRVLDHVIISGHVENVYYSFLERGIL